jgi:hypothetical protein
MVFAPYVTSSSVRNTHYTHITAIPLQLHPFVQSFRCPLSLYPNTNNHSRTQRSRQVQNTSVQSDSDS